MNKESLKYVLREFTDRSLPATRPREVEVPLQSGKIVGLVGVRRSGKTFLMFHTMSRLMLQGVARNRILYLNFEDDRLYPVAAKELDLILTAHGELYPDTATGPRYLFLDEVQAVSGWERYVRRVHDMGGVQVFVTGSSSAALKRDLAPALRGRSILLEVFPLSFPEFLSFRSVSYTPFRKEDEARIVNALEQYVSWGGLPELALAEAALRPLIIEEYSSLLFFRDLVERYGVRNEKVMRLLLKHCCSRPASLLSVHRLHRDFISMGLSLSKNTLYEYLEYLQDAMVLFLAPKHERSLRKQEQNPRKIHLIDPALTHAFRVRPDEDIGHKLENVVFLHERRRASRIYYQTNAHELDVIVETPEGLRIVNVCWSLGDREVLRREQASLEWGRKRYPKAEALLVAHEEGDRPSSPGEGFATVTAWRYLMGTTEPAAST